MTQHPHAELSAYIDGALDPAAHAAVDGHLVACAACRAHVSQLRATAALVRSLPDPVPSRRLVPRLAPPAWLAPMRTLMTLASGAAVFLFIASALLSNITFLASTTGPTSLGRGRGAGLPEPAAARPAGTAGAPGAAPSPDPGYRAFAPTSPAADAAKLSGASATPHVNPKPEMPAQRADQPTAAPSGGPEFAFAAQDAERVASSPAQRAPLLNPWLWLGLAVLCGAIAIALNRRLRSSR